MIMNNEIFLNSKYFIMEYMDMIKNPFLTATKYISSMEKFKTSFNLDVVSDLSDAGLLEWYINRKERSIFRELAIDKTLFDVEMIYKLENMILSIPEIIVSSAELNGLGILEFVKKDKIAQDVIVYYPYEHADIAKEDLDSILNLDFKFMTNFDEILDLCGSDSTYFLSDIDLVTHMYERGVLGYSSVTLAYEYRYNRKNLDDFKIDFEDYMEDAPYKLSFMGTCCDVSVEDMEELNNV